MSHLLANPCPPPPRDAREPKRNARTEAAQKGEHLYVIHSPLRLLKIGRSGNPRARMRSLQCACGVPLKLLHVGEGNGVQEKVLHERLKAWRKRGEWFRDCENVRVILRAELGDDWCPGEQVKKKPGGFAARVIAKMAEDAEKTRATREANRALVAAYKNRNKDYAARLAAKAPVAGLGIG